MNLSTVKTEDLLGSLEGKPLPKAASSETRAQAAPVQMGSRGLPTSLPEKFDSPETAPTLSTDPDRQLEEYRVRTAAKMTGVDPHLAAAVGFQESGFKRDATSKYNVKGTMQVTQNTGNSLGFNRDDPDENILAGVSLLKKGLDANPDNIQAALSIYPDPNDAPKWIPAVLSHYEKSKSATPPLAAQDTSALLNSLGGPPQEATETQAPPIAPESTVPTAGEVPTGSDALYPDPGTLAAYMGNTGLYGQGIKGIAGVNTVLERLGLKDPESVLLKEKPAGEHYDRNLEEVKRVYKEAGEKNPGSAAEGNILGAVSAPGGVSTKGMGTVGKMATGFYEGGRTALASAKGADPDVSNKDAAYQAILGALLGGGVTAGGQVVKKLGARYLDTLLGRKGMGDFVDENFGVTKNLKSLKEKSGQFYKQQEAALQTALKSANGAKVPLPKDFTHGDIRALAQEYLHPGMLDDAAKIEGIANFAEKNGHIMPEDANFLKRIYGDKARTEAGIKNTIAAKSAEKGRLGMKQGIESVVPEEAASAIEVANKNLQSNKLLSKSIDKASKKAPAVLGPMGVFLAAHTKGLSALPHLLKTVPGATTTMAAGNALSSPALIDILAALLPAKKQYDKNNQK